MCINPLFLCVLAVAVYFGVGQDFCLAFSVALLHECGHMFCAHLLHYKILKLRLMPWGVCMETEAILNARHELWIAAAGPLVNLSLAFAWFWCENPLFLATNLFMLLVNLLPILPLDGGRIVRAVLASEWGIGLANRIMRILTALLSVLLFGIGTVLLYKTGINFSVLLIAVFVACSADTAQSTNGAHTQVLCRVQHMRVLGEWSAKQLLKIRGKTDRLMLDVVDTRQQYLGTLTAREVLEEIANSGYEIKFNEILQKHLQN